MNIELSNSDKLKLKNKIITEYGRADKHTQGWKNDVQHLSRDYLLPKPWQDKVKIRKVLNNLTLRLSIFLSDTLQVTNVPSSWVLGQSIADNGDKVFKSNFRTMKIKNKYREALIDDAMQGVGVLVVDWWNDHTQEPIVSYIDSRLCYPDPKNWQDNTMLYFGTKVRKSWYELECDEAYDQVALAKCRLSNDTDQQDVDRANDAVKGFCYSISENPDQVDLYNHLTIFKAEDDEKACVYLATYGWGQSELVRLIKMRPLTDGEIADPSTVDFGVQLFRAKPLKWSFAGVSLIDDIGQYQDIETLLTNLQIEQAKEAGLGGKTYVNTELGVDLDDVSNSTWPWDVIPFTSANPQINAANGIYKEQSRPQNPIVQNTIGLLDTLSQEADPSGNSLTQWTGTQWNQPLWETKIQMQNLNGILMYMATNYMDALIGLWTSIYRSYDANMSSQRKKDITLVDSAKKTHSYWFKKNEFISKWDVYITIESEAQVNAKKKQDFAVLLSVYGSLKQSLKPWSTQDIIVDRMLIEKSGISWLDAETIHPYTVDERKAYSNLELLNNNIELKSKPQPWEDHNVYINIYKTGLETPARDKAIELRELILEQTPAEPEPTEWGWGWAAQSLGASMLASDMANQVPSTADVSA